MTLSVSDLYKFAVDVGIKRNIVAKIKKRDDICSMLKDRLIYLEKYATPDGDIPKRTYLMVPFNHPVYPFPLNLHDRLDFCQEFFDIKFIKMAKKIKDLAVEYDVHAILHTDKPCTNHKHLSRYNLKQSGKKISGTIR